MITLISWGCHATAWRVWFGFLGLSPIGSSESEGVVPAISFRMALFEFLTSAVEQFFRIVQRLDLSNAGIHYINNVYSAAIAVFLTQLHDDPFDLMRHSCRRSDGPPFIRGSVWGLPTQGSDLVAQKSRAKFGDGMYFRRPSRLEARRPRRVEAARHNRNSDLVGELPTAGDLRVKPSAKLIATHQWREDDFGLAVRSLRAFLQRFRQWQEPPASNGRKAPSWLRAWRPR